jgi:hypothetical protein
VINALRAVTGFLFRNPFRKDITWILLLKLLLLVILWYLFFSHPTDHLLSPLDVATRFLQ